MNYEIAIVSLGRAEKVAKMTLSTLFKAGINCNKIKVFIVEAEREAYVNALEKYEFPPVEFVSGVLGVVPQREFAENYYPADTNILFLDDDLEDIDLQFTDDSCLDAFITRAFTECRENRCFIWSIYPTYNPFFRQKIKFPLSKHLNFMVGAFYGIINRPTDPELKLTLTRENGEKDDVERTLKYFIKDKIVMRYNSIGFKTKYFGTDGGGLGNKKTRKPRAEEVCKLLLQTYEKYGKITSRKDGYNEFKLKKTPHTPYDSKVTKLEKMEDVGDLLECLNKKTIPTASSRPRRGCSKHTAVCMGMVKPRLEREHRISRFSRMNPDIHNKVWELGKKFVPFDFNAVHLNKNVVCPPHYDSENVGDSVLFSFGDYEGCKIVVNDVEYDAYKSSIMFDGSKMEHYNTPLVSGTKYSLVFYNNKNATK